MKLLEYKRIIDETSLYPQQVNKFGYAYTIMGLLGEIGEVFEKLEEEADNNDSSNDHTIKIYKEVGGCLWYVAAACKEFGLDFEQIIDKAIAEEEKTVSQVLISLKIFNTLKKIYRDDKPIDKNYWENMISFWIGTIFKLLFLDKLTIQDICKTNYDELIRRRENNTLHGDGDNR